MPLSDDQKAMLRLLAQREQGYDDLAALMGLSVEEVRAKVNEALAQLEDEGVAPPPLPAEPPAAMTTEEPEPEPPAAEPPAPAPESRPEPPPPPPSKAPAKPESAEPAPARRPAGPPKVSLPSGKGARAAIAAGIAAIALIAVILIVSGGDSGESTTTSASATTSETTGEAEANPTANANKVTKAVLEPVAGGSGTGVAIFGRVKNSLALQVEAEGLAPTAKNQAYTIWLAQSPQRMLPLASTPVKQTGKIGAQFEVPTEVLAYLANGTFDKIVITLTGTAALKAALAKATKEERAPEYTGTEVLAGTVTGPIIGAALRKEEQEKEEEAEKGE